MSKFKQLDHVLVIYVSDPVLVHQRVLLSHVADDVWVVMSPDRDIFTLDLRGSSLVSVAGYPRPKLPPGYRAANCHLESNTWAGAFTDAELRAAIANNEGLRRQKLKQMMMPDDSKPGSYRAVTDTEKHGLKRGDTLLPTPACPRTGKHMLVNFSGDSIVGEWVADVDFEEWRGVSEDGDVRILPIQYDLVSGERHRSLEESAALLSPATFGDWPIDGPRSMSWFTRNLRKSHLTFLTHHQKWIAQSGIRDGDRVRHEHSSLCRALDLLASYDQLNIANLAGAEAMLKRVQLIEEAYHGRPSAPSFEAAEHYLGIQETTDGSMVDPILRKHASLKIKDEIDVKREQRKYMEELREAEKARTDAKGGEKNGDRKDGGG